MHSEQKGGGTHRNESGSVELATACAVFGLHFSE